MNPNEYYGVTIIIEYLNAKYFNDLLYFHILLNHILYSSKIFPPRDAQITNFLIDFFLFLQ